MIKNELRKKLGLYTLASGAMIAATNDAEAQVVYSDFSDVTVNTIGGSYLLDLNGDATNDFELTLEATSSATLLYIKPLAGTGAAVLQKDGTYALKLDASTDINAAATWGSSRIMAGKSGSSAFGDFKNVTNKYVGLRLKNGTDYYYGWLRLTANINTPSFTVESKAYNSTVNSGLLAGQTVTTAVQQSQELMSSTNVFVNAQNEIVVDNNSGKSAQVEVMNTTGGIFVSKNIADGASTLPSQNLTAGIYAVRITVGESIVTRKVFIR